MSDQNLPEFGMPRKDAYRKEQQPVTFPDTAAEDKAVAPFANPGPIAAMDTVTDAARAASDASLAPPKPARRPAATAGSVDAGRPVATGSDAAAAIAPALPVAIRPAFAASVATLTKPPTASSAEPAETLPANTSPVHTSPVHTSMERVMTTAEEMMSFQQGNFEALVKSGQIWAAGLQDLGRQWAASAQAHFDETVGTVKAMTSVKSLREAVELQSTLARTSIEKVVAEGGKLTDASLKLTEQTMAPITARLSVAAERFGRTA